MGYRLWKSRFHKRQRSLLNVLLLLQMVGSASHRALCRTSCGCASEDIVRHHRVMRAAALLQLFVTPPMKDGMGDMCRYRNDPNKLRYFQSVDVFFGVCVFHERRRPSPRHMFRPEYRRSSIGDAFLCSQVVFRACRGSHYERTTIPDL